MNFFFLPFILWNIFKFTHSSKWKINFLYQDYPTNQVIFRKGRFTPIDIALSSDEYPSSFSKTVLKLSEDSKKNFIFLNDTLSIDTGLTLRYSLFIGLKCDYDENVNNVTFDSTNIEDFELPTLQIANIDSEMFNLNINFHSTHIPIGGFGAFVINEKNNETLNTIYNIYPIEVEFETKEPKVTVDSIKIKPFSQVYESIFPIISKIKSASSIEHQVLPIAAKYNPQDSCFKLSEDSFLVEFSKSDLSNITEKNVEMLVTNNHPSTLTVRLSTPVDNSMIYCVLFETQIEDEFFSDDDVMAQKKDSVKPGTVYKFFSYFFTERSMEQTLILRGLNRTREYKSKCIYTDNNTEKDKQTISVIKKGKYSLKEENPIYIHCAKWVFKSISNLDLFTNKITQVCNSISVNEKRDYAECGQLLQLTDNLSSHICIYSDPISFFEPKDSSYIISSFTEIMNRYNDSKQIELLGITSELEEFSFEIDIKPNVYNIYVDLESVDANELTLTVGNENSYDVSCLYGNNISLSDSVRKVIIKSGTFNSTLSFPLPSYTNQQYTLVFECGTMKSLVDGSFSLNTSTFYPVSFTHSDDSQRLNCTEAPYLRRCIKKNILLFPQVDTVFPNKTIDIEKFKSYSLSKQINFLLESADTNLADVTKDNIQAKLIEIMSILIYMQNINCSSTINDQCFELKKKITTAIANAMFKQVNITDIIFSSEPDTEFRIEKIVKTTIAILFYSGNNGDGFDLESSLSILSLGGVMMNNTDKIIGLLNGTSTEKTVSELLDLSFAYSSRLLEIIPYIQSQLYETESGLFVSNEGIESFKNSFVSLIYHYTKYYEEKEVSNHFNVLKEYSNFDLIIIRYTTKTKTFTFSNKTLTIEIPIQTLISTFIIKDNVLYFPVILYKKYPLLNHFKDEISNYVVSMSIFAENKVYYDYVISNDTINISYNISTTSLISKKYKYGYMFINSKEGVSPEGVVSDISKDDIIVTVQKVGDVMLGSVDKGGKIVKRIEIWMIMLCIIGGCVIITVGVYCYYLFCGGEQEKNLIEKAREQGEKAEKEMPLFKDDTLELIKEED